jgi:uncharacterized membrane protein YbhN (UPF0104 family)
VAVALLSFVPWAGQLRLTAGVSTALFLAAPAGVAVMVWLAFKQQAVGRWLTRLLGRWPRLLNPARSALPALDVWREGKTVLALWAWTAAIWAVTVLLNQLILWSLDIRVSPVAPIVILVVLQVGVRLPSSPGSIGVFHYLGVLALSLFGVDKSVALGYGVILHLVTFLPASLMGLLFLGKAGYSVRQLRQAASGKEVPG